MNKARDSIKRAQPRPGIERQSPGPQRRRLTQREKTTREGLMKRLRPTTIIACLALFLSLGGGAWAAG
jgi:hypothetical protein